MGQNRISSEEEAASLIEQYSTKNYNPLPVTITEAEGVWVRDVEGNKYMDMLAGYSALSQGHCHPEIIQTAKEQAERLTLTSRAFQNDQLGLFLKDVCEITDQDLALPMNSGAEAVETAVKGVRKWGHEKKGLPEEEGEIIVCSGNFHGRTTTIISFSSEEHYREGFGPYTPGFKLIEFGNVDALREAITDKTIGFMVEPIQGESGIRVPPEGYLKEVRDICNEADIALMLDEIQTGLGRTGKWMAADHEEVKPDVMILGKALSGGAYPVSAAAGSEDIMEVFKPGTHGSTFGGNPLGAAIGRTAIRVLKEENLVENSRKLGAYLKEELKAMNPEPVEEIRGKGLFIGVEIKPEFGTARPYVKELKSRGILAKDTHGTVIRFAPPLVIQKDELDWALERIEPVLTDFRP